MSRPEANMPTNPPDHAPQSPLASALAGDDEFVPISPVSPVVIVPHQQPEGSLSLATPVTPVTPEENEENGAVTDDIRSPSEPRTPVGIRETVEPGSVADSGGREDSITRERERERVLSDLPVLSESLAELDKTRNNNRAATYLLFASTAIAVGGLGLYMLLFQRDDKENASVSQYCGDIVSQLWAKCPIAVTSDSSFNFSSTARKL